MGNDALAMRINVAMKDGNDDLVEYLIERGADVNYIYENEPSGYNTMLEIAIQHNNIRLISLLMDYGADPNILYNDATPLIVATLMPKVTAATLEFLLEYDIDIEIPVQNIPPLHWAIITKNYDKVKILIEHGADVNIIEYVNGFTPIHIAAKFWGNGKAVKLLLQHGADSNIIHNGKPMLMSLFDDGKFEIAKVLIENGAELNMHNKMGETPLYWALFSDGDYRELVRLLVSHGADMDTLIIGRPVLHHAILRKLYSKVELLLELGANVETVGRNGITALMSTEDPDMLKLLLNNSISADAKRNNRLKEGFAGLSEQNGFYAYIMLTVIVFIVVIYYSFYIYESPVSSKITA
jgi:ankyrin repeat protein